MNVLVYSGPEILASSLSNCITSLRTLLVPNYAVQSVTRQALSSQAWVTTCAMLVFPACRSLSFDPALRTTVEQYIRHGGKLLTLGASVKVQAHEETNVASPQERLHKLSPFERDTLLLFTDTVSGTRVSMNLGGRPVESASLVTISMNGLRANHLPYSGNFQGLETVEGSNLEPIIYASDGDDTRLAAAKLSYGKGMVIFSAILIDHPLTEEPLASRISTPPDSLSSDQLQNYDAQRQQLSRVVLDKLDLLLPEKASASVSPLPQILTCTPTKPWIVDTIMKALSMEPDTLRADEPAVLQDSNDTFQYFRASDKWDVLEQAREKSGERRNPATWNPKQVLVCRDGLLPSTVQTPLFDVGSFYKELSGLQTRSGHTAEKDKWRMGEAFMYGEVVTSTQTLIDKNTRLLSSLPSPLVSFASHQLMGRGRGGNVWVSPSGCLQFSLLLRVSLSELPANKLVFVQYLFGIAVTEACRDKNVLGEHGKRVRIKWPNDVYAVTERGETKKICGILVSTSFSSGKAEIVIGSGLNVFNPPPIQSLIQLVPSQSDVIITLERTAATILAKFEKFWETFVQQKGSFESFLDLYYERWLHSDQVVELATVTPSQMVRIVGITSDYGLLRTMPERDGWAGGGDGSYIDLQPDGNSFDLMAGLIKAKT